MCYDSFKMLERSSSGMAFDGFVLSEVEGAVYEWGGLSGSGFAAGL